jgi:hypothetical protein
MCDKRLQGLLEQRPLVLCLRHANNYISINELGMLRCVIFDTDHEIFFMSKIFSFCLSLPFLFWKCDVVATTNCSIDIVHSHRTLFLRFLEGSSEHQIENRSSSSSSSSSSIMGCSQSKSAVLEDFTGAFPVARVRSHQGTKSEKRNLPWESSAVYCRLVYGCAVKNIVQSG